VARITGDRDVAAVAGEIRVPESSASAPPSGGPWQTIATDANGAPIVTAAQAGRQLLVVSAAAAPEALTPVLIRSILDALSPPSDAGSAEIVPIPDAQLRAWERTPGPALTPDADGPIDDLSDDRRWLWAAALCLLALEGWMRSHARRSADADAHVAEENQRVA
jgi:hypothetical protein